MKNFILPLFAIVLASAVSASQNLANPDDLPFWQRDFLPRAHASGDHLPLATQGNCPDGCSGRGVCMLGLCVCDSGYEGISCEKFESVKNTDNMFDSFTGAKGDAGKSDYYSKPANLTLAFP